MSHLRLSIPVAPQLSLVLHTAADYVPWKGIGIGIVQRAPTGAATVGVTSTNREAQVQREA